MKIKDTYETILENFRKLQEILLERKAIEEEVERRSNENWMQEEEEERVKKMQQKENETEGEMGMQNQEQLKKFLCFFIS